jgi:1,6-anhydro-N-acetylmuramate kinase
MSLRIDNELMALEVGGEIIATARFRRDAAADGQGAWVVSDRSSRLFSRNQAITALTVTELLAIGHGPAHPLVLAFEEELR